MNVNFIDVAIPALPYIILLAAWVVALVFSIRIFRRKGERAELLLLIGACLMLAGAIISIAIALLTPWTTFRLSQSGWSRLDMIRIISAINIFRSLLSLGGIVLLVIAFWKKFRPEKEGTAAVEDRGDLEL